MHKTFTNYIQYELFVRVSFQFVFVYHYMALYGINPLIISAAFSPTIIHGTFVFPDGIFLRTEQSATRRPCTPLTLWEKMFEIRYN